MSEEAAAGLWPGTPLCGAAGRALSPRITAAQPISVQAYRATWLGF